MFIHFDTIPACDRQTDRNTIANTAHSIAAVKNEGWEGQV